VQLHCKQLLLAYCVVARKEIFFDPKGGGGIVKV